MNKRIDELIEECTSVNDDLVYDGRDSYMKTTEYFDKEKFSELIVRECVDCLKPLSRNHSMVGAAQDTIKEHFGVEE